MSFAEELNRLEAKKTTLDKVFKTRQDKIEKLKLASAYASNEDSKFELDNKITKEEEARTEVEEKLQLIEQEIEFYKQKNELQKHGKAQLYNTDNEKNLDARNLLYYALLDLNFQQQVESFQTFVASYPVGAWIIHGEENYGQRWLLNRLVQLIQQQTNTPPKVIKIALDQKSYSNKIDTTWRELSKQIGFTEKTSQDEIIRGVCQCGKTQSVIFIFHKVHTIQSGWIHDLINDFWKKLVESYQNYKYSYKLLMFLVDEDGCVEKKWNQLSIDLIHPSLDSFQNHWKPDLLIKMPIIQKISCPVLTDWKKTRINLSLSLFNMDESGIQSLLDKCHGGLPQLVLEAICEECNGDWYDMEEIWLKY